MNRFQRLVGVLVWVVSVAALLWQAGAQSTTSLTRYPYLQDMRPDRVTVVWTTPDLAESGVVEFSTDRSYSRSVPARVTEIPASVTGLGIPYYKYEATLTGLSPGVEYFYRVLIDGGELAPPDDFQFRTAAPGPFTFLAFGDSGWGSDGQRRLAQFMFRERPALVVHTGDIAYLGGTFEQFRNNHFAIYSPLMRRVPFFPSPGNHEYDSPNALPYVMLHANPTDGVPAADHQRYYSFDWGDVHFTAVDVNTPLQEALAGRGEMIRWLDNDLRRSQKLWRIVYFHHPVRPTSNHERDPTSTLVREHLEPIFDRHHVQLILSGHEHTYQQAAPRLGGRFVEPGQGGTVNIITGGGGAPLYSVSPREGLVFAASTYHYVRADVDGARINLRAIDDSGQQIDQLTLTTPPVVSRSGVVNAASFTTSLAPGSLVSIFGRLLGAEDAGAARLPLPTELAGVSVTTNGRRLPLMYVGRGQINAQLPFDVQGATTLRITSPGGSVDVPVTISEPAPAIFSTTAQLGERPAVIHTTGALVSDSNPARPGEVVSVFLTGLGRPEGEIAAGQAAPAAPLLSARGPIEAQIGATSVTPGFAGLAPGFAGLYQVNLRLPANLLTGTHAFRIVARGISSNTVNLVVRQ